MKPPLRALVSCVLVLSGVGLPAQDTLSVSGASRKPAPRPEAEVVEDVPPTALGGATLYSLGEGMARLRYPLSRSVEPLEDAWTGREKERFFVRWLDRRVHDLVPGAGPLRITAMVQRRVGAPTEPRRRSTWLEVSGPDARLVLARDFLDRAFEAQQRYVDAEFRLVQAAAGAPGAGTTPVVEILTRAELERQLAEDSRGEGARVLTKGRLTFSCGEQASWEKTNAVAYVKDYEITTTEDSFITDPVIDVVKEGVVLDLAGVARPDDGGLCLSAALTFAHLARPIRTFTTRLAVGGGTEVTVQLPEVTMSSWASEDLVLGPDEAGFVVRGLRYTETPEAGAPEVRDVALYCRIALRDVVQGGVEDGRLIALDPRQNLLFARFGRLSGSTVPKTVTFLRKGREVGRGEVQERQGNLLVIRPLSGDPREGDAVR